MSTHPQSDWHKNPSPEPGAAAPVSSGLPEAQVCRSVPKLWTGFLAPRVQERAIVDQDTFLHTLSLERKRSERSGKSLLLLVLRSSEVWQARDGDKALREFQRGLGCIVRDTDVVGWHQSRVAIGIIFTDLVGANEFVAATILARITDAITRSISPEYADKIAITCRMFPDNPDANGDAGNGMHFYPDVRHSESCRRSANLIKRIIDVFGSLLALVVLSPLFLLIALLIKLSSPGPVLFRQTRVGRYGKPFTFLKFRSMYVNNDSKIHQEYVSQLIAGKQESQAGAPVFKIQRDPRVTRLGWYLRRTSLDELPQFFNVLKGEMSLVGPRPPVPYEVEKYQLWHWRRVLEVKPGITGLWQVSGRSKVTFNDMVRLDLKYARTWSIGNDLKILWMTPKAVLSGAGAY